jgi:predicted enzyme related to lactoylglutathione lyase
MTMNHGVVHFEIPANDPDKLSQFYTSLFGWEIQKMAMDGGDYWAVMSVPVDDNQMPKEAGAINGGLFKRQEANQGPVNYVNVESVDQYLEKAKGLGANVAVPKMPVPGMGWFAQMVDPDGNAFGLWQTDPAAK